MTTYYVSSEIGNNDNAGTSESAPLATLQAAADLVKPGDIVEVMNGTYTAPAGRQCAGHYHQWYCERPHYLPGCSRTDACHQQLGRLERHQHRGVLHRR